MSAADDVKVRAVEVLVSAPSTRSGLWGFADRRSLQIARDVVAELAAAGLLADPDALTRAKAEAWVEGWDLGTTHGIAYQAGNDDALIRPPNPHRVDRIDPTEGTRG